MVRDVEGYLSKQINKNDVFLEDWTLMQNFYSKRLWHQLTMQMEKTLKRADFKERTDLTDVYENFIADFEHRINPLSLVEIMIPVSEQIMEKDPATAVTLLEKIKEKIPGSLEASVLCSTAIGMIKLTRQQDTTGTRELIEATEKDLDDLVGITSVHARFYQLSSLYHKTLDNKSLFYREALRYLGCTDLAQITIDVQRQWAADLAIAALLGADIYNFGELLMHDVFKSLDKTPNEWLVNLIYAFNRGAIESFDSLASQWKAHPALAQAETLLRQKITLLALMEMIFRRPANERTFRFDEIAVTTRLSEDEIELVVMRALAKGLIKGRIDEVHRRVTCNWVQPRVLDLEQIASMQSRLKSWTSSVDNTRGLIEVRAKEILT